MYTKIIISCFCLFMVVKLYISREFSLPSGCKMAKNSEQKHSQPNETDMASWHILNTLNRINFAYGPGSNVFADAHPSVETLKYRDAIDDAVKRWVGNLSSTLAHHGNRKIEMEHKLVSSDGGSTLHYFIDDLLENARLGIDYHSRNGWNVEIKADFLKGNGNVQNIDFYYSRN